MTKRKTSEEIYKQTLEAIRDFCMDRDFNLYCEQILETIEYALKKGSKYQANKPNEMRIPPLQPPNPPW